MPRINLLPWRAELRQKRKKEFMLALLGTIMIGGLIVYASKLAVQARTSGQHQRNEVLTQEIATLDKQIEEIKGLRNQRERLFARMKVIDQLQRSRPEPVHLFDELVDAMPEGVYLTAVTQTANRVELQGGAQSSTRVSALMRNISESQWLADPGLDIVQYSSAGSERTAQFKLFARQVPVAANGEAGK